MNPWTAERTRKESSCSTQAPFLIFFGSPGAGKTTVCAQIIDHLRKTDISLFTRYDYVETSRRWYDIPVRRKVHLLTTLLIGFRDLYDIWFCLGYFLIKNNVIRKNHLRLLTKISYLRRWLFYTSRDFNSIFLLDHFAEHGICELILGLDSSSVDQLIEKLAATLYRDINVHFVFLDIDANIAVTRIIDDPKNRSWAKNSDHPQIRKKIHHRVHTSKKIAHIYNVQFPNRVITLSGAAPTEYNVSIVLDYIHKNLTMRQI